MPVWCLLAALIAAPAGACGLQVELLYTAERLDGPPASAPVLSRVETDAAAPAQVPLPRRPTGHWLRLTCRQGLDARSDWRLVVTGARGLGELTFYAPGAPPHRVTAADSPGASAADSLRGGWSLALPQGWPAASVAYLHAEGVSAEPMRLRLARADELARERRDDARRTVVAAAVLLAFALVMGTMHVRFRDRLHLGYAAYLACVAACVLLLGGDAAHFFARLPVQGPDALWAMATLAAAAWLAFARRVLEFERFAPTTAALLQTLFWLPLALLAVLLAGGAAVHALYATAGSALLLIGAGAMPVLAWRAWRRGVRQAGACVVAWLPMSAVIASIAGHRLDLVAAPDAERWLPLAAIFETAVLVSVLSRDVAARARQARRARRECDALTGALGAGAFERRLDAWCASGAFARERRCLLLLGIDDFADLGMRHGRAVGDTVLRQVHARLRAQLRPGDTVARIDDGFAIVGECPHDGRPLARRLADAVAAVPLRIDGQTLVVTASIGVAAPRYGDTAARLMQRARQALVRARSLGRNAVSSGAEPPVPALAGS
jgi:diguanylate cyclase (GGDEF)-like protein